MNFQARVHEWVCCCFGVATAGNIKERNHRFLEEAIELAQAGGCTEKDAITLVGYVYSRPVGVVSTEIGDVAVSLAAFCNAHGFHLEQCAELGLSRCNANIEKIRAKQARKPAIGPLPGASI